MELYKYQGAGNDFLIADNRDGDFHPSTEFISNICDRHYGIGADGLMLLETAPEYDFKMVYYNSDGSGGMMCGNGGRCITACAADLGITPRKGPVYEFIADDGPHLAELLLDGCFSVKPAAELAAKLPAGFGSGHGNALGISTVTVRLRMVDVEKITNIDMKSFYLETGTRHFVKFVSNLSDYPVVKEGRQIRHLPQFGPIGTNVNFVEPGDGVLKVRTFEKGVEAETLACGTGITASAIAALHYYTLDPEQHGNFAKVIHRIETPEGNRVYIFVKTLVDHLAVDFLETHTGAGNVWLTGPAAFVCKVITPDKR